MSAHLPHHHVPSGPSFDLFSGLPFADALQKSTPFTLFSAACAWYLSCLPLWNVVHGEYCHAVIASYRLSRRRLCKFWLQIDFNATVHSLKLSMQVSVYMLSIACQLINKEPTSLADLRTGMEWIDARPPPHCCKLNARVLRVCFATYSACMHHNPEAAHQTGGVQCDPVLPSFAVAALLIFVLNFCIVPGSQWLRVVRNQAIGTSVCVLMCVPVWLRFSFCLKMLPFFEVLLSPLLQWQGCNVSGQLYQAMA